MFHFNKQVVVVECKTLSEIIAPANPVHASSDMFFAGWDTDFDGTPNELASSVTITKNLNATAIFYHKEAFESIYDSTGSGFVVNSGRHVQLEQQEYAAAPKGNATKVTLNEKGENVPQDQHLTINIPEARSPKGIAVWLDCTGLEEIRCLSLKKCPIPCIFTITCKSFLGMKRVR